MNNQIFKISAFSEEINFPLIYFENENGNFFIHLLRRKIFFRIFPEFSTILFVFLIPNY